MNTDEVRLMLARECAKAGGQKAWAVAHGITQSHVSMVVTGQKPAADAICAALGVVREIAYRRMTPAERRDAAFDQAAMTT